MSNTHLDAGVLHELKDILEGEFPVLLHTYVKDSVARLQDLEAAFAAMDADGVRRAAHSLKGSSANLGLLLMAQYCGAIEDAGRAGALAPVSTLLASLREERATVERILLAYI